MVKYIFRDTDDTGFEEYDICGEEYKNLIETCCKYSVFFSLIITDQNSDLYKKLKEFEVLKDDKINYKFDHYSDDYAEIKYYKVCQKLCSVILENTNNIFCWINGWGFNNPEDPTFYRKDGSVFFTATTHDGICNLFVENEEVSHIVSNKLWAKY